MKNEEIIPRSIEGDWDWCETSMNLPERGWTPIKENEKGEHIWSFIGDKMMVSKEWDFLRYVVEYGYDPEKLRLSLKGHQLNNKAEPEMLVEEYYRVEFVSPTEMYLYDLENVAIGKEEESLRLLLRKI